MPFVNSSNELSRKCRCGHSLRMHMDKLVRQSTKCYASTEGGYCTCEKFEAAEESTEPPFEAEESKCSPACAEGHTYSGSCIWRAYGPLPQATPLPEDDGTEEPFDYVLKEGCAREGGCTRGSKECFGGCAWAAESFVAGARERDPEELEALRAEAWTGRRPPYGVAYRAGDRDYEVLLPGDAIATVEDGVLKIQHAKFLIAGLIQVRPWGESA